MVMNNDALAGRAYRAFKSCKSEGILEADVETELPSGCRQWR